MAPPADGMVLYRRARSSWRSVQSSESNELPASLRPAGYPERERTRRKRYRAPSAGIGCSDETCGSTTEHASGGTTTRHVCPYCSAEKYKTYSTFQDWKNHLHATHEQCLEYDDPLEREEYAASFKLDRWERFHDIEGDETDRAYLRMATLRKHYGRYQGQEEGEPPGPPSTIRLPHTKGTTPDQNAMPTESKRAGSEQ